MKNILTILAFLFPTNILVAQVIDKDGNNYKTVQIGSQVWMAENLNVSHFRNGDVIPEIEDNTAWDQASSDGKPAWCYYADDSVNGRHYHKLYNWYAVSDPRGLAPDGWHVPSTLEFTTLTDYLGGEDIAGGKMKTNLGWDNKGNGTNESGFRRGGGFSNRGGGFADRGGSLLGEENFPS